MAASIDIEAASPLASPGIGLSQNSADRKDEQ